VRQAGVQIPLRSHRPSNERGSPAADSTAVGNVTQRGLAFWSWSCIRCSLMLPDRHMPAEIDLDLDAEQLLGVIPADVLERLWPGFVPQDRDMYINPVSLRRHLQGRPDFVYRVAALNLHATRIAGCLATASVFARYDKVALGEAGVTAYVGVPGVRGDTEYLGVGMHLYPVKQGRRQPNHVTTLMPPISAKGLEARLKRQRHYRPEDGPDGPPSFVE